MATLQSSRLSFSAPINHLPFSFAGTADDMRRLQQLLKSALMHLSWQPKKHPVILNLACGRADETGMLIETLTAPRMSGLHCDYLGIDLRYRELQEATRRWSCGVQGSCAIHFRQANLSAASVWQCLPRADVIVLRHQNFYDDPHTWDKIFQRSLNQLQADGLLILTSYFEREHQLALASLLAHGARIQWNTYHHQTRVLDEKLQKSVDRHLAILSQT